MMTRLMVCFAALLLLAAPVSAQTDFRYDAKSADVAAHWAARATLASAVMLSGLGEPLNMTLDERDAALRHAGFVTRPPQPKVAIVGAVYAGGGARFKGRPDPASLPTLRWDEASFDRTLDPAAQAWTLVKITSPAFHLQYHEPKEDKRIGLMMWPQAVAQAQALARRLQGRDGLYATRAADGTRAAPAPRDQAAALWAASNLILAATSARDDYWHKAWRDLVDADDYRPLADAALAAVEKLPPRSAADRAIAIEALGRYALAAKDAARRGRALALARTHAESLTEASADSLEDIGLSVYGLIEAGRLLGEPRYGEAAAKSFRDRLVPRWSEALGAFAPPDGRPVVYTPRTLGALFAGLNAMRWHGPADAAREAEQRYPRLFETVLVRAGMLLSSPLALVTPVYRDREPDAHFAHPALASPVDSGRAPVFAAEVRHERGAWRVSDARFRTADAMFLAVMLAMRQGEEADPFLAADRLAALRR